MPICHLRPERTKTDGMFNTKLARSSHGIRIYDHIAGLPMVVPTMNKNKDSDLPAMMDMLRKLKGDLEKVCADALRHFEEVTGLTVEDIELIRNMNVSSQALSDDMTRIATVKITMRL